MASTTTEPISKFSNDSLICHLQTEPRTTNLPAMIDEVVARKIRPNYSPEHYIQNPQNLSFGFAILLCGKINKYSTHHKRTNIIFRIFYHM